MTEPDDREVVKDEDEDEVEPVMLVIDDIVTESAG